MHPRTKPPKPRRMVADIPPEERQEYLRERVLTVLQSYGHPMDTNDVRKALGMHKEWHKSRKVKALYNAITWLKKNGKVVRNESDYTLSLPS
jgi:predicted RNA-binding protein (virulence factor B family)